MIIPKLTGQFISLEPLKLDHLSDLEKDFDPYLFHLYPRTYGSAEEFVRENLSLQEKGNYLPFSIVLTATNEAIGCTEFSSIDLRNRKLEIGGSWLKSHIQGSPANSEAKYLMLQYAFETLQCVRVQFTANALNVQSRSAIERIGGRFEGVLRNSMILPDGQLRDDVYYSIISREWPEVKQALERRIQRKLRNALILDSV